MADTDNSQLVDLLIHARWMIPVVPDGQVLENCSLVVHQGRIQAIVPWDDAHRLYRAEESYELNEHILIPGLVNAHNHAAMALMRGYADDYPLQTWLQEHIWPAEGEWVSPEFVREGTRLSMAEMIRSGTTCFSDMYFFPDEVAREAVEAGMRCQITFPVFDFPSAWGRDADDYIHKGLALHDDYRSHPLVEVVFGPHAPYTVSDEPLKQIATVAAQLESPVQIHLHETAREVEDAVAANGGERPIQRLHRLGLLGPQTQCVHMTQLTDQDIELVAQTGAHVVHCPESNLKLASGFCPVQKLLDAGVNVALGTDGAASNNDQDLLGEMRTAALLAKGVSGDAGAVDAHTALRMATLNGARALGLEAEIGSLEVGKAADITAIAVDNLESLPLYNPVSLLTYGNVSRQVSDVWVNGHLLLRGGQLQTLDEAEIRSNAQSWQAKLKK
ncbi:TRZ/ATZ family hydrolase [Pseudomaricurvus alkylphenolicus]|uniref:TRZ/ATZ family hydrolase n=1 Tax=Pseudomaricurvus alkylphenolicus TaxID=1306991 RepID=UPI00142018E7|nr:TRZ/ATZ family hydrolase [Pseudomaricurvus alkylphenolicus]NIB42065.1 TRZ/ATZ family hydrolase [Pseudomaricurvus alkylphenolicus]